VPVTRMALLAFVITLTAAAGAQDWDAYRVAGTLTSSAGQRMAIVELPDDESLLVAEGDELDGGEVVEIGERFVRLRFVDTDLLLPLSGGPAEAVPSLALGGAAPDDPHARRVPTTQLLIALDQLGESLERQRTPQPGAAAQADDDRAPQMELADRLRGLLDLPAGAGISNINGQAFASVAEGLGMVERLLSEGELVRFELERDGPFAGPIYVYPE